MAFRFRIFLFALLIFPSTVFASDPTGLIVWFIEFPIFAFSCSILLISFYAPKVGGILLALLIIGTYFVLAWAYEIQYMDSEGNFLRLSVLVDIVCIVVIIKKNFGKISDVKLIESKIDNNIKLISLIVDDREVSQDSFLTHRLTIKPLKIGKFAVIFKYLNKENFELILEVNDKTNNQKEFKLNTKEILTPITIGIGSNFLIMYSGSSLIVGEPSMFQLEKIIKIE